MPPRLLHVANGTSVTQTIVAAGIPGTTSIWADPLHDGPVPGGLDDEALMEVRRQYLAPSPGAAAPENDMHRWRQVIANHDVYDELVLWYEHDLFCQLNLIQLLTFVRTHVPGAKPVSLVCIDSFPGHPNFHGLGELEPGDLASLFDARAHVGTAQFHVASVTWESFRASSPAPLDLLLHADLSALPFLARALERFLEEYPWVGDGLSRTERRLLTLAAEGRADWPALFPRMHEDEDAFYISDLALLDLKRTLQTASPPLLAEKDGAVSLTTAGHDVLDGRADRVTLCGLDRWFGGVHLQGRKAAWRWDATRRRAVHG